MNIPLPPSELISVCIGQTLSAKKLDSPHDHHVFELPKPPTVPTPFPARIGLSGNQVKWLVIKVEGKEGWFGWPFGAIQNLIDTGALRIFVAEDEIDELKELG